MKNSELNFKQLKACHYIVGGLQMKQVSDLVGVTEQTLFRWLKLPAMQSQIRAIRRLVIENSVNDLLQLNKKAVKTLADLLDCDSSPPTRCRAAATILNRTTESIDFFEYESRLRRIEENLDLK